MAELNFGSDSEGFARALEQMQQLQEAKAELDAKDQALRGAEEAATGAIIDNTSALQKAITETHQLATATSTLSDSLRAETSVLAGNTAAWEARIAAMAESASVAPRVGRASAGSASVAAADVEAAAVAEAPVVASQPRRRAPVPVEPPPVPVEPPYQGPVALPPERRYPRPYSETRSAIEQSVAARRQLGSEIDPAALGAVRFSNVEIPQQYRQRATAAPQAPRENISYPPSFRGSATGEVGSDALLKEQAAARQAAAAEAELTEQKARAIEVANEQAAAQERVNLAYNQSVAAYAESSTALSRNGALTTEFIQAFARGDVTLKEFESQMVSTIGKFGGWAVAGGLVYGAYDALKKLGEGAKDTQEGVQQLSRFIPGAQTTQRAPLESTFRDISTQLNVPISEVTSAMQVMARTFHDVTDAGQAARAVLLAGRLDQIPQAQAENYFTGIAQSLGMTGPGGGAQLVGVVNSLNALQNQYGARVNQTLPALARAAPAAQAAGLATGADSIFGKQSGTPLLEALAAVGVRSGIPGAQVGTALLRSMGTFAFRPQSEQTLRGYGINPERGHYGDLISQIVTRIVEPGKGKELTGTDLQAIAGALGGPLLGTRTLLPILEHANLLPKAALTSQSPPSAQAELNKVLGGTGEEFKKLGIELENVGSELESAGLLQPVQVLLQAAGLLGSALEKLLVPVDLVAHQFDQLPGPLRSAFGILVGVAAARRLAASGVGFTARNAIGQLPGAGFLRDQPESAVRGTVARYRTFQVPRTERALENARGNVVDARAEEKRLYPTYIADKNAAEAPGADKATLEAAEKSENAYTAAVRRAESAAARETALTEQLAEEQGIVLALTSKRLTTQEKINLIESQQLAVSEQTLTMMEDNAKAVADRLIVMTKGGGGTAGGASAGTAETFAGTAGAAAAATAAAAGARASTGAANAFRQGTAAEQGAMVAEAAEEEQPGALADAVAASGFRNSPAANALRGAGDRVKSAATGIKDAPFKSLAGIDPFALLIGSQIAGGVLPGGVGDAVGSVGTTVALGAWGSSLAKGPVAGLARRGATFLGADEAGAAAAETRAAGIAGNPLLGIGLAGFAASTQTGGGVGGYLEAVGSGAALGAVLGSEVPIIGTGIGAVVGGVAGGVEHYLGMGSDKQKTASQTAQNRVKLAEAYREQVTGGLPQAGSLADFADTFQAELQGAFGGTGTQADQQAQQQGVQKQVADAVQLLKESGYGTGVGRGAAQTLTAAIGGAISSPTLRKDPSDIGQIIDTASQGLNTGVSTRFNFQLGQSTSGAGDRRALAQDVAGVRSSYNDAVTKTIQQLNDNFNADWSLLQRDPGNAGLKSQLAETKRAIAQAKNFGAQIKQTDIAQVQSDAATALQQQMQRISDNVGITTAEAGGNKTAQLKAQLSGATQDYNAAWSDTKLSPSARRSAEQQAQAQQISTRFALEQQPGVEMQARAAVRASTIPDYDQVAVAGGNLKNATDYYKWILAHKNAFDPSDINAALVARNQARQALNDANYQYNTSLISANEQLAEANDPADQLGTARSQIGSARRTLGLARTTPDRITGRAQVRAAQNAAAEAARANADQTFQITETEQGGDPVAAAMTQLAQARYDLAHALGPDEVRAANLELAQATQTLHGALQGQIVAEGQLKASTSNDPVTQDNDNLAAARKALAEAVAGHYGRATVRTDTQNVNSLVLQHTNDYVSQRLNDIQFQQQTLQVSAQGAVAELQGLLKLKNLSKSQREQIQGQIYSVQTSQDNTSLFDLAPAGASVKTPTIYDVRTAAAHERGRLRGGGAHGPSGSVEIGGATINTTQGALNTHDIVVAQAIKDLHSTVAGGVGGAGAGVGTIVFNIGGGDVGKVADTLDRTLGTRVKARMRSNGMRGT